MLAQYQTAVVKITCLTMLGSKADLSAVKVMTAFGTSAASRSQTDKPTHSKVITPTIPFARSNASHEVTEK